MEALIIGSILLVLMVTMGIILESQQNKIQKEAQEENDRLADYLNKLNENTDEYITSTSKALSESIRELDESIANSFGEHDEALTLLKEYVKSQEQLNGILTKQLEMVTKQLNSVTESLLDNPVRYKVSIAAKKKAPAKKPVKKAKK
jgi:DNA anti-recombination protein RmuC